MAFCFWVSNKVWCLLVFIFVSFPGGTHPSRNPACEVATTAVRYTAKPHIGPKPAAAASFPRLRLRRGERNGPQRRIGRAWPSVDHMAIRFRPYHAIARVSILTPRQSME